MACTKARAAKARKLESNLRNGRPVAHLTAARRGRALARERAKQEVARALEQARRNGGEIVLTLPAHCANGVEARYWRLGSRGNEGLKAYGDRETRDLAYRAQRVAAKNGFGPRLSGRFDARINGERCYCLLTEHCPTLANDLDRGVRDRASFFLSRAVRRVFGAHWGDAHGANFAIRRDGSPMIIDYGSHSFQAAPDNSVCSAAIVLTGFGPMLEGRVKRALPLDARKRRF